MVCIRAKIKQGSEIEKTGGKVEFYFRSSCQESFWGGILRFLEVKLAMGIPEWFVESILWGEGELGKKESRKRKQIRDVVSAVGPVIVVPPGALEHELHHN